MRGGCRILAGLAPSAKQERKWAPSGAKGGARVNEGVREKGLKPWLFFFWVLASERAPKYWVPSPVLSAPREGPAVGQNLIELKLGPGYSGL
jgi:hypothetical protein